jgi:uncharacterized protein YbjT (DUF2867 family)
MTATLIGSTGLIGGYVLEQLLHDPFFDVVRILIRKPVALSHPRLEKKIVDFNDNDSLLVALSNSDVVFCCVGTTNKKVRGNKDEYRKVDFDIPVKAARFCKMTGCEKFMLVSSAGAHKKSTSFYLKLKGEVEETVIATGLKSIHILRPSLLLGKRNENRLAEDIGKVVMTSLSFLIPAKYKAIHGQTVASAMVEFSKLEAEGIFIHENEELLRYGR